MANNYFEQSRGTVEQQNPGYLQTAYICPLSKFATIGAPGAGPGASKLTIPDTNDHTFAGDDGWIKLYSLPHKATGSSKTSGANGSLTFNHEATLMFPGDGAALHQFLLAIKNDDCLVLLKDANGKTIQLGDASIPCNVEEIGFEAGTTDQGDKGYVFKVKAVTKYWYEGDITLGDFTA